MKNGLYVVTQGNLHITIYNEKIKMCALIYVLNLEFISTGYFGEQINSYTIEPWYAITDREYISSTLNKKQNSLSKT